MAYAKYFGKDNDALWKKRGKVKSVDEALKLISDRTSVAIARLCRMQSYSGYDFNEYDYDDEKDCYRDVDGDVVPDFDGDKEAFKKSLEEIGEFAEKFKIPFNVDMQYAIGINMSNDNNDAWHNSSIGC